MEISKGNVLVIGGSGYLGSHVADSLTESGYTVTIFDRAESSCIVDDQKFILGNLELEELSSAMADTDYVYNFAAISDIQENNLNHMQAITTNVVGASNIFQACHLNGVKKLIHASTMYVYSEAGGFYKATKQSSEAILEAFGKVFGLNYSVLRYGSLYGPRSQPWNGLRKYVEEILKTKKIIYRGAGDEMREYIHVRDAAALSVQAIGSDYDSKSVMITGNQNLSSEHILSFVFEVLGLEKDIEFDQSNIDNMHYKKTPFRYQPDVAIKLSPTHFVDFGQGIIELIEDIKSNEHHKN